MGRPPCTPCRRRCWGGSSPRMWCTLHRSCLYVEQRRCHERSQTTVQGCKQLLDFRLECRGTLRTGVASNTAVAVGNGCASPVVVRQASIISSTFVADSARITGQARCSRSQGQRVNAHPGTLALCTQLHAIMHGAQSGRSTYAGHTQFYVAGPAHTLHAELARWPPTARLGGVAPVARRAAVTVDIARAALAAGNLAAIGPVVAHREAGAELAV
jgi:hypothetical protein